MEELQHVPIKFKDGILKIDHQIFQTLVQRVIEAFVGQHFRLSNHPVTKHALKEAVIKCNRKQSANTNQKTYKKYKLNGAVVDPNDRVFQYTFFLLILSEWRAACISRSVAVEKSFVFFELLELEKATIMSVMQADIDNVTQLWSKLKKEYEGKVKYTQDGSPLTNEFKCLVHYDSVQDTFFCEDSVLGIVIETLTEFLLPAPDGSLRHEVQEDHEPAVQEILNKLYNFDHIRNEKERSIVNEEDKESLT
ncbi:predicted protein [Chaetoceros tenuissimus]|uniref:Uncharacterized protein n=1 Tax=Chaetoceros tenuissimus TaxID=426638 RepID=A0AAD3HFK6_9STRA|nr:predicted protein [Chaetoceros tenuissimus]